MDNKSFAFSAQVDFSCAEPLPVKIFIGQSSFCASVEDVQKCADTSIPPNNVNLA